MADAPSLETPPVLLTPPGAFSAEEAKLFQEIGRKLGPLPEGIDRLEFHFSEDSTGAPAVWIVLAVTEATNPSKSLLAEIQELGGRVQDEILYSDSERWPYLRVVAST